MTEKTLKATEQQIRSTLLQDVLELTARFEEASNEFEMVTAQDGVQRIEKASGKLSTAREALLMAHRRLDECSNVRARVRLV